MKKALLLLSIVSLIISSYSVATPEQNLRFDFDSYIHLIMEKEFDSCTYYMPEKIFEIVPKDKLVEMMEKTMNDPSVTFKMFEPKVTELGKIEEIEGSHYAILKYSMKLNLKYNWDKMPDYEPGDAEPDTETILLSLKSQFGKENVTYNEKTKFYNITSKKKVAGISKNGITDWKFAVLDPQQAALAKMILPTKIIEEGLD